MSDYIECSWGEATHARDSRGRTVEIYREPGVINFKMEVGDFIIVPFAYLEHVNFTPVKKREPMRREYTEYVTEEDKGGGRYYVVQVPSDFADKTVRVTLEEIKEEE